MENNINKRCKSFTSLEQSKKLAEILPLESADMWWLYVTSQGKHIAMMHEEPDPHYLTRMESYGIKDAAIRCWSLAALLDVLPNFIGDYGKCLYYDVDGYYCGYMVDGDFMLTIEETKADNQIDACYEMIIKLHEQNLL